LVRAHEKDTLGTRGSAAARTDACEGRGDPLGDGWTFEPKLDGFRCMVCTHGVGFRARSRRGWEMSHLLPELRRNLPSDVQLDGEIVALDETGRPDFHRLSSRMLHGRGGIAITYFVFDLLAVEGLPATMLPYSERRAILEEIELENHQVKIVATFEDGEALFAAVCTRGLEGIMAKRDRDPYRPGERAWVKTKNRATARFAEERERVGRRGARPKVVRAP
jgi:bifunctional non-homologous end joining protein LigD